MRVRNLGAALLSGFDSGSLVRLWLSHQLGHSHLKARGCLPNFTHTVVTQSVGWSDQLLVMWISPQECLNIIKKWQLASLEWEKGREGGRERRERERARTQNRSLSIFYNLILDTPFLLLHSIDHPNESWCIVRENYTRVWISGSEIIGAILKASYHIWWFSKLKKQTNKKLMEKIDPHIFIYDKAICSVVGT